jgi:hypothetical protein
MERNHYPSRGCARLAASRKLFELLGEAEIKRLSLVTFPGLKPDLCTVVSARKKSKGPYKDVPVARKRK